MDKTNIEVDENQISEEEWALLVTRAQQLSNTSPAVSNEKRGNQPAVPENAEMYLNRAQLSSISKLESFGWELFFIRRSCRSEILTVMYLPRSGETAVIEKDGTVNRAHGLVTRTSE